MNLFNHLIQFIRDHYNQINSQSITVHVFTVAIIVILLIIERRVVINIFKKIDRKQLLQLAAIVLLYAVLLLPTLQLPYLPNIDGWDQIKVAGGYYNGDYYIHDHGTITAFLIYLFFLIFGKSIAAVKAYYFFIAICQIPLIYSVVYVITKNHKKGLVAVILYITIPLIFSYAAIFRGRASTVQFSFLIFLFCTLISVKLDLINGLILGLVSLCFLANTQQDSMILILPFLLYFYCNKKKELGKQKKMLVIPALIFLMLFIYYLSHTLLEYNIAATEIRDFKGEYKEVINGMPEAFRASGINIMDFVFSFDDAGSFSLKRLPLNFFIFLKKWFYDNFLISILFIIGVFTANKKVVKYLIGIFIVHTLVHLSYFVPYDERFQSPMLIIAAIFGGIGFINVINRKINIKIYIVAIAVVVLFIQYNIAQSFTMFNSMSPRITWTYNYPTVERTLEILPSGSKIIFDNPLHRIMTTFYNSEIDTADLTQFRDSPAELKKKIFSGNIDQSLYESMEEFKPQRQRIDDIINPGSTYLLLKRPECEIRWFAVKYQKEPAHYVCKYILNNYETEVVDATDQSTLLKIL